MDSSHCYLAPALESKINSILFDCSIDANQDDAIFTYVRQQHTANRKTKMKTAIVINNSFDGIQTITLVGNENPKGYDWWMYGGIRQVMPTVEAAKQWATANGNRYSGCFNIDPWNQWVSI